MLVIGGKNLQELQRNNHFKRWFLEARRLEGRVKQIKGADIVNCAQNLSAHKNIRSNDVHILALAVVSKARLVYTNDRKLQKDITDPKIISNPNGALYTTARNGEFRDEHRDLLNKSHCRLNELS